MVLGGDFGGALVLLLALVVVGPFVLAALVSMVFGFAQHRSQSPQDQAWRERAGIKVLAGIAVLIAIIRLPFLFAVIAFAGYVTVIVLMRQHQTPSALDRAWWRKVRTASAVIALAAFATGFTLPDRTNAAPTSRELAASLKMSPTPLDEPSCSVSSTNGETTTVWSAVFATSSGYDAPLMRPTQGLEFIDMVTMEASVLFAFPDGTQTQVRETFALPRFADQVVRGELVALDVRIDGTATCGTPRVTFAP